MPEDPRNGCQVIIEFIGPNGVGKRSVIGTLARTIPSDVISLDLRREAPRLKRWQALVNNPVLFVQLHREVQFRRLMFLTRRDAALKGLERSKHLVLVDEGPRHGLLSSTAGGRVEGFHRIHRSLRSPDLLVSLEASVETLLIRLRDKHESHWAHKVPEAELRRRLARYVSLRQELVGNVHAPTVCLETDKLSVLEVAEILFAKLSQRRDGFH